MNNFDEDGLQDISMDEINDLFKDIIETPQPLIATVCFMGAGGGITKIYLSNC